MDTVLDKFSSLFTGSQAAHGEWVFGRKPSPAATIHTAPSQEDFEKHLRGEVGLGVVPVNAEARCRFAAIDIDVDTINHSTLYSEVTRLNLPLHVCRSKSGGAHLYVFMEAPGLSSDLVRQSLTVWAGLLGYPTAEIFPKQKKSTAENIGNWINLPYYGGDATTRYCVGLNGSLTLQEFLDSVKYFDPNEQRATRVEIVENRLPPCLQTLKDDGVGAGYRNQALLNYAIFYRKSTPGKWEENTQVQNSQYFSPPLDLREVRGVIQSAGRTKYQYTCESEPLRSHCDKAACLSLPYGVGHMPWQEAGGHDELSVSDCRKLLTDPPKYIVNVNTKDITLTWDEFYSFQKFKSKIGEVLNVVIAARKQLSWEQTVRDLLSKRVDIEAPDDASMMGLVVEKLHEFLVLRERSTEREDILRGLPIQVGEDVLFRASDFKRYLQGAKLDRVEGSDLFLVLRTHGATHSRIRVGGRMVMVWSYPVKKINEQTEDFKVANFAKDMEHEV